MTESYKPRHQIRIVTAASLFDGHDAAINVMRRIMQRSGAEVIHLGHNRSVEEILTATVQEDAQAVAITSYQGGHNEFFRYLVECLKELQAGHVKVFAGGGGTIVPSEIEALEEFGVTKIYSPEDGRRMGLQGMIDDLLERCDYETPRVDLNGFAAPLDARTMASALTQAEAGSLNGVPEPEKTVPVIGLTGPGGAGKSCLTDEIVRRFLLEFPALRIAVLSVDPTRKRGGGALLGDRIRMNAIDPARVFVRSFATRAASGELSDAVTPALRVCKAAGYDVILVETSGIGQGDVGITGVADVSTYVMTPEYGAASQLEKIDMLDYADMVAINKFDRRGAEDALRDVRKQVRRNRQLFHDVPDDKIPVYGTVASRYNDAGVSVFFNRLLEQLDERCGTSFVADRAGTLPDPADRIVLLAAGREHYLGGIARTVRDYHERVGQRGARATQLYNLEGAAAAFDGDVPQALTQKLEQSREALGPEDRGSLEQWDEIVSRYQGDELVTRVRDRELRRDLHTESLSGTRIPRIALPSYTDWGERLRWLLRENVPGEFPYTAGVFHLRRRDEDPQRQFAGEGTPARTNQRYHYLCRDSEAHRLSVAFDSVTLYGEDPHERPDIYGKVGESGVSICTLHDMRRLFEGFDLCNKNTSVSMTINGPAPRILAFFFNAAIDQQVDRFREEQKRDPGPDEWSEITARTLKTVRGTVQADILKEDQAQNTCIFGTEFSLKVMGDVQEYFVEHSVRNFYSVSISGYHIAEAGANPITQLALTLANGFTYVEYYLSRGMKIDDFAPNLSFFFSNGLDPEYAVLGRVARRIWSVVMRERYGANERSQKLKYHIQTSGRSLHAQEVDFNDIRTTLQALYALDDNCNSLHTNAYDEAITTPTEESVRRAMAVQLILLKEFGVLKNENSTQGSYLIEALTDHVEDAVLQEFERLDERGGVLGAMELGYQRGKIQDESLLYEHQKSVGQLPIVGVNTFVNPRGPQVGVSEGALTRATPEEKQTQLDNLREWQKENAKDVEAALAKLREVALGGGNVFAELMRTARVASLGQITHTLYEIGGQYRRSM